MKSILTPLFLFFALQGFTQNAYIRGSVSDFKTKETLVGAAVTVDDSTGTVTDISGNYFFKTTPGAHILKIKAISYKEHVLPVNLKENDTLTRDTKMESDSKELG